MTSVYEVQQLLKRFGTIIYTGDRLADLQLMAEELQELQEAQLLEQKEFEMALFILRQEMQKEADKLK